MPTASREPDRPAGTPHRTATGATLRIAVVAAAVGIAAVFGCVPAGSAGAGSVRAAVASGWAADSIWDDGRAEVSAYDAVAMRYGEPRPFTAYSIVVKEDFSRDELVKADPGHDPSDLFTVLKLHQVIDFRTGVSGDHQVLSVFFDRSDMIPVKLSLAHSDWCGNTYKELQRRGDRGVLRAHTYWDGMAERTFEIPFTGRTLLYDELPVWLRAIPWEAKERNWGVSLIPTRVSSRAEEPGPRLATLKIAAAMEMVESGTETLPAYRVDLDWEEGVDSFRFHARPPHVMLSWDRSDGGRYRLLWSRRMSYWDLNGPGDGVHLQVTPPPVVDYD